MLTKQDDIIRALIRSTGKSLIDFCKENGIEYNTIRWAMEIGWYSDRLLGQLSKALGTDLSFLAKEKKKRVVKKLRNE